MSLNGSGSASKYSGQGQPLVYQGVVYMVTGADDVFAVDVDSGKILWSYLANLDDKIDTVCCGWSSRGLGLGDGKLYVGQLDGKLVALDQRTGAVVWSTQAERWQDGLPITSAPLYYNGLVITGFAGGDRATRGRLKAFDAKNGSLKWTFYTIPGPGELGHDTWPQDNDAWKFGGASIWQTPAIDPELGLIYFSTSNPGPDLNGGVRRGDNLFSASIVALDVATGKYRWHFQEVHHDIWDYDAPNPVVLFDAPVNGTMRKGIAEVGKTGFTYILDRATGKPLIGIEERPVPQEPRQATSPTQPYPIGDPIVPHEIDIVPEGFEVVNKGAHLHAVLGQAGAREAAGDRRRELAAELVRPRVAPALRVRARRHQRVQQQRRDGVHGADARHALRRGHVRPRGRARARHLRGRRSHDQQARVAPAVGRDVLQRLDRDEGRARVRRPQRQPLHRARQDDGRAAVGLSDRRGRERDREHVRAQRQAIRRRARRGIVLPGHEARRQPVAVLARRKVLAGNVGRRARARRRRARPRATERSSERGPAAA